MHYPRVTPVERLESAFVTVLRSAHGGFIAQSLLRFHSADQDAASPDVLTGAAAG
jgi:hypothetical protein